MKVTIVSIVIGAFGTKTKGLLKGLADMEVGGRVEAIQMTALLRTAMYGSKVKWNNLGNGAIPFPTPRCSSY